jgi:hypothetical protein
MITSLLRFQQMILKSVHSFHESRLKTHIMHLRKNNYRPKTMSQVRLKFFFAIGNCYFSMCRVHKFYQIVDIAQKTLRDILICGRRTVELFFFFLILIAEIHRAMDQLL